VGIISRSILYFGCDSLSSTSRHRADALRRLGCQVAVVDPQDLIGARQKWQTFIDYITGYRLLQRRLLMGLMGSSVLEGLTPDLVWVNGGELMGPLALAWIRKVFQCPIVLYNNDDPTGIRDRGCFSSLNDSMRFFDLCVLCRPETALEALAMGAGRVLRVLMSYDEITHQPAYAASAAPATPPATAPATAGAVIGIGAGTGMGDGADTGTGIATGIGIGIGTGPEPVVSFIGTLIAGEGRDDFLVELLQAGLPLRLIGNSWQRSRHWPLLRQIHQGPGISGTAYAQALASAAVTLGLLSHGNRDLITTRSLEAPACGALFCAERTSEHQLLYEQGQEALFWSSTAECIELCQQLLDSPQRGAAIRQAGLRQVRRLGVGNEDICRQILAAISNLFP